MSSPKGNTDALYYLYNHKIPPRPYLFYSADTSSAALFSSVFLSVFSSSLLYSSVFSSVSSFASSFFDASFSFCVVASRFFLSSFIVSSVFCVAFVDASSFLSVLSYCPFSSEFSSCLWLLFFTSFVCTFSVDSISACTKSCSLFAIDNNNISARIHNKILFDFFHILHSPYFLFSKNSHLFRPSSQPD